MDSIKVGCTLYDITCRLVKLRNELNILASPLWCSENGHQMLTEHAFMTKMMTIQGNDCKTPSHTGLHTSQ